MVKPLTDAEPGYKHHCAYKDPPYPDHHVFHHCGVMPPAVVVQTEAEDHHQETVSGMDLYIQEIQRAEGQCHEYQEFNDVKYREEPEHSGAELRGREMDHHPLQQVNGDHTQQPARKLPEEAQRVQKSVPDNTPEEGGDAHQDEVKHDLPVYATTAIKRSQLPGTDQAGNPYQHIRSGGYRFIDSYPERKNGGLHMYIRNHQPTNPIGVMPFSLR